MKIDILRIHRPVIHVINNCEGPGTLQNKYITFVVRHFNVSSIQFSINTKEQRELLGVEPVTSGFPPFDCYTMP